MYALPNKTQHKLIVKVRGGISQKLDTLSSTPVTLSSNHTSSSANKSSSLSTLGSQHKIIDEAGFGDSIGHLPKPVFNSIQEKHGSKAKSSSKSQQRQHITPEHNEMIKFVQSTWKGVERDYKKSVNKYINNLDLNNDHHKAKHAATKKKSVTSSTPLLLTGSYHHTSTSDDSTRSSAQDSFQPFDLEAFWGNRILKRLTEDI